MKKTPNLKFHTRLHFVLFVINTVLFISNTKPEVEGFLFFIMVAEATMCLLCSLAETVYTKLEKNKNDKSN